MRSQQAQPNPDDDHPVYLAFDVTLDHDAAWRVYCGLPEALQQMSVVAYVRRHASAPAVGAGLAHVGEADRPRGLLKFHLRPHDHARSRRHSKCTEYRR